MLLRVAGLAFVVAALAGAPSENTCDLKKVESGWWCGKDGALVDAKDVDTAKNLHKATDHPVARVDVCVKSETRCQDCPMKWASDASPPG